MGNTGDMASPELDPDVFDQAIMKKNGYYRRGCAVGAMIAGLPEGPFRQRLVARLGDDAFSHAAIRNAVQEVLGVDLTQWVVGHHRRGACRCPESVRS